MCGLLRQNAVIQNQCPVTPSLGAFILLHAMLSREHKKDRPIDPGVLTSEAPDRVRGSVFGISQWTLSNMPKYDGRV